VQELLLVFFVVTPPFLILGLDIAASAFCCDLLSLDCLFLRTARKKNDKREPMGLLIW